MRGALLVLAVPLLATGCLSQRFQTDSARSVTEQLLVAEAAENRSIATSPGAEVHASASARTLRASPILPRR